jgi:hypothetical protein
VGNTVGLGTGDGSDVEEDSGVEVGDGDSAVVAGVAGPVASGLRCGIAVGRDTAVVAVGVELAVSTQPVSATSRTVISPILVPTLFQLTPPPSSNVHYPSDMLSQGEASGKRNDAVQTLSLKSVRNSSSHSS